MAVNFTAISHLKAANLVTSRLNFHSAFYEGRQTKNLPFAVRNSERRHHFGDGEFCRLRNPTAASLRTGRQNFLDRPHGGGRRMKNLPLPNGMPFGGLARTSLGLVQSPRLKTENGSLPSPPCPSPSAIRRRRIKRDVAVSHVLPATHEIEKNRSGGLQVRRSDSNDNDRKNERTKRRNRRFRRFQRPLVGNRHWGTYANFFQDA